MILRYFFAWFGLMILAILNGGFRDAVYSSLVGEHTAHQISTVIFLLLITVYLWFISRVWIIQSSKQAWNIGIMWFLMTEVFEFGMVILIQNEPWDKIFYAYNIFAGQLWILIPLYVLIAPYILYRLAKNQYSAD
jgi:hypothetical protein